MSFMVLSMWVSVAVLAVACLLLGTPLTGYSPIAWRALLGLGLVSQLGGWIAITYALGHIRAPVASVTLLGQPVLTACSPRWSLTRCGRPHRNRRRTCAGRHLHGGEPHRQVGRSRAGSDPLAWVRHEALRSAAADGAAAREDTEPLPRTTRATSLPTRASTHSHRVVFARAKFKPSSAHSDRQIESDADVGEVPVEQIPSVRRGVHPPAQRILGSPPCSRMFSPAQLLWRTHWPGCGPARTIRPTGVAAVARVGMFDACACADPTKRASSRSG